MAIEGGLPAASHAAAPAGHGDHGEHADHDSFRAQVLERVIRLGTMDRRLRLVVGAAVAQLVVAAIMIALRQAHQPSIIGDVTDNEESAIPVATFVVATVFLTVAWSFLLAGALHAHRLLRIPAFALFAWAFAVEHDTVTDTTGGTVAALALMVAIAAITVLSMVRDRKGEALAAQRLLAPRLILLLPLVGGLYLTAWLSSQATDNTENFTTAVAQQLYYLEYLLIPLLVLAGADFADWGQLLGTRAGAALRHVRSAWPVWLATAAVAVAVLVDARRVLDQDFLRSLGLGAILVVAVVLLLWVARPRAAWSAHLPFTALAVVVVIDATLGFLVEQRVGGSDESISDHIYAISAVFWAGAAVICLVALLVRRRNLPAPAVAAMSFVILVGVCNALFGLSSLAAVFPGLHLNPDNNPLDLDGVRAVVAAATLLVLLGVVVTRRLSSSRGLIVALLAANVAVQILAWVDQLFNRTAAVADQATRGFSIWAAVVLLGALLLEILGSGEAITNRHDRRLPRQARVLLYLGYVTLVAAAVLYFASLHDPAGGALRESQFDSESWVHEGVFFLGVPLVLTLFISTLLRRRAEPDAIAPAPPATAST